jgi:dTDP-4-dehydrorhamnose 3,5-epimerase
MFEVDQTELSGVVVLRPIIRPDRRGRFVKTVHGPFFEEHGLPADFAEQYYSVSRHNVLRGMHFQTPPADHYKLVTCLDGTVFDVVVDLRRSSQTYAQHAIIKLDSRTAQSIYIPAGFAHGFYVLSDTATVLYNVSTVYSAAHDTGVRWDSVGVQWPTENPILSDRDAALPALSELVIPCTWSG